MSSSGPDSHPVVIIGAGPAGLEAALAAANAGVDTVLVDGYTQVGGQYYRQPPATLPRQTVSDQEQEAATLFDRLRHPQIKLLLQTQVLGVATGSRTLWLHGPDAPTELPAAAVVLATGAYDRPAAFPGWTLPGVMALGAAQSLVKGQRVLPGKKVLLAGTGPLLLALGAALTWGGAGVVAVLEASAAMRRLPLHMWRGLWGQWSRMREGARYLGTLRRAGVPYQIGWGIVEALGTPESGVTGAVIAPLDREWLPDRSRAQQVECEAICIGYGFVPRTALSRLAGAAHLYQAGRGGWVPVRGPLLQTTVPGLFAAGDCAGIGGARQSALEGRIAGAAAASLLQPGPRTMSQIQPAIKKLAREHAFQRLYGRLFTPAAGIHAWSRSDTVLCRCENVCRKEVAGAIGAGADSLTAVKGLTRAGMGACQGRLCSQLIAGQIAQITGKPVATGGQFSVRAPIYPLPIEAATERVDP